MVLGGLAALVCSRTTATFDPNFGGQEKPFPEMLKYI